MPTQPQSTATRRLAVALIPFFSLSFAPVTSAQKKEGYTDTPKIIGQSWRVHDADRPQPKIITPGAASTQSQAGKAPSDAVVLFDGKNLDGSGPCNYYVAFGTSMASPLAAGATALLIEAAPDLTPSEVRDALRSTASNAGAPDNMVGSGLIDILAAISQLPPPCPWDCTQPGDGSVGISDFLLLLAQWGGPGTCDIDGGGVGITDFLALLAAWGPCP